MKLKEFGPQRGSIAGAPLTSANDKGWFGLMTLDQRELKSLIPLRYQWWVQDFPEVGTPILDGLGRWSMHDFAKISQNCMKLKEFVPFGRGVRSSHPLRSANGYGRIKSTILSCGPLAPLTPCRKNNQF